MRTAAVVLVVAGVLAVGAGVCASLVLPCKTIENRISQDGRTVVTTVRQTVWGRSLWESFHVTYASEDAKPHGEGVGDVPDEYITAGPLDAAGARHGRWTYRARVGDAWSESDMWYKKNEKVTREEWSRR